MTCNVVEYKGALYAIFKFPATYSLQIQYVTPTNFQVLVVRSFVIQKVYIAPGSLACLQDDALALENELVQFELDENGIATSVTMPNYVWSLVFVRG